MRPARQALIAAELYRPCCYNCGEGGHTADECWRERPPLMRNEQQPALSQGTWGSGRAGGNGYHYGSHGSDGGSGARYTLLSWVLCHQRKRWGTGVQRSRKAQNA